MPITVEKNPLEEMSSPHSQQKSLKSSTWVPPKNRQNFLFHAQSKIIQYNSNSSL